MAPGIKATSAALESWGHLWVLWVKTSCSPQPAMGSTEVGGGVSTAWPVPTRDKAPW